MKDHRYDIRLQKLQSQIKQLGCDALLIEDKVNLYYLTGMELSVGKLLVWPAGGCLLVDSRYYEMCKKQCPVSVLLSDDLPFAKMLCKEEYHFISSLGFDSSHTVYRAFLEMQAMLKKIEQESSNKRHIILCPIDDPLKPLRMIKDSEEIDALRNAATLGSQGYDYVLTLLKEGITEKEVALELEIFWKKRGSKGLAFDPIIAFGRNGSMPHYRAGNDSLKMGDSVLIDIGVNFNHYHSDMTRVVFFGEPDPKIEEIYSIVQQAQAAALELCRPGTLVGQLDEAARQVISSHGYGAHFSHSLGHGVGLEIHEYPTVHNKPPGNNLPLEQGMVITIEPGIYIPDKGGVRIENTIVITEDGYEDLTKRSTDLLRLKIC